MNPTHVQMLSVPVIDIAWSSTMAQRAKSFLPNHFVPVLPYFAHTHSKLQLPAPFFNMTAREEGDLSAAVHAYGYATGTLMGQLLSSILYDHLPSSLPSNQGQSLRDPQKLDKKDQQMLSQPQQLHHRENRNNVALVKVCDPARAA